MNDFENPAPDEESGIDTTLPEDGRGLRDRLRERREQLRTEKTIDLLVPGYDGEIAVRYHALPGEEAEKIAQKMGGGGRGGFKVAADFLVNACETILVLNGTGIREPLVDDDDKPLRFDSRLADYLEYEAQTATEVVIGLFSPERNRDLAIVDQATSLLNWMQGREREIDGSLLGE